MMIYNFTKDGVAYECDIDGTVPHPETGEAVTTSEYLGLTDQDIAAIRLDKLREVRDRLIAETDWWAGQDRTMTQQQVDYRQALRDITNTYSSVEEVVWPTKPA
jgi:hypothetical protein